MFPFTTASTGTGQLSDPVRHALCQAAHTELSRIDVLQLENGVRLSGKVSSFYLKQLAQEIARKAGVRGRVHNEIKVKPR